MSRKPVHIRLELLPHPADVLGWLPTACAAGALLTSVLIFAAYPCRVRWLTRLAIAAAALVAGWSLTTDAITSGLLVLAALIQCAVLWRAHDPEEFVTDG